MAGASVNRVVSPGPLYCLKVILEKEGSRSLFRGLGPNLVGVTPSRAIYFAAYSNAKEKLNGTFDPDSTQVHMISAQWQAFTVHFSQEKSEIVSSHDVHPLVTSCRNMD
ncbi:Solute carrier family 25 member 36 [Sciurus carolinensis]|uniref:Solute carrier family 25 member 36 n=1 Tax=Sciurus carolinensis TaxID=30640 RepID=A0AA41N488_SCICA|nr:Solute carrier family 25 member 36 [Sciurus carolinensis]